MFLTEECMLLHQDTAPLLKEHYKTILAYCPTPERTFQNYFGTHVTQVMVRHNNCHSHRTIKFFSSLQVQRVKVQYIVYVFHHTTFKAE
jgi:hypothetical protein